VLQQAVGRAGITAPTGLMNSRTWQIPALSGTDKKQCQIWTLRVIRLPLQQLTANLFIRLQILDNIIKLNLYY
jgi:hypothetical protein